MKARFREKNLWQVSMEGTKPVHREASNVRVTDIQTGDIVKAHDICNPFAKEGEVSFYDDTHIDAVLHA